MLKVIGMVRRRPAVSTEELIRSWCDLHALARSRTRGLRGYVVSEVLRQLAGDLEADAFVEEWWDGEDAAADDMRAGGRFWLTREHVLKRPLFDGRGLLDGGTGQRAGRVKAIGTAYRRDDFTPQAFFDYWRDVHAPISAKAPGLGAYVVSEVLRPLHGDLAVDAFVEQWWDDEATFLAAGDSPEVAAAWADVANYARTTGSFWLVREHVMIAPPYEGPGLLER